jgi:hypothetical protein
MRYKSISRASPTGTSTQLAKDMAKEPKSGMDAAMAIAKDWMAGGTAAGISKTLVAPIGNSPRLQKKIGFSVSCACGVGS